MHTLIWLLIWRGLIFENMPEIKGYNFSNRKSEHLQLPKELSEASGLSFNRAGHLLCHDDEQGVIYEIDYRTGNILKRFFIGKTLVHRADLEGIAVKLDTIFMVNSSGNILRFLPGKDKEKVAFQTFKTPLALSNDVEGLTYDPVTDCLLLACKGVAQVEARNPAPADQRAVYAFSLKTYKLLPQPRFLISIAKITASTKEKEFAPSAIERHPRTGHFFVLAARGNAMVELDAAGNLLGVSSLPKSLHPQPEGLAIAADGTLVICNEGGAKGKPGRLVVYSPR